MFSSSCIRVEGILLPVEERQVFFFLWKSCSYSSSCGRAAGIILSVKELRILCFFEKVAGIIFPIGKIGVFFLI